MTLKILPFERHRLQPEMHQHLKAFLTAESIRVQRLRHRHHLAVHRAYNSAVLRRHRDPVPDNLLGKHRIRHLIHRHRVPRHRRDNTNPLAAIHSLFHIHPPEIHLRNFVQPLALNIK